MLIVSKVKYKNKWITGNNLFPSYVLKPGRSVWVALGRAGGDATKKHSMLFVAPLRLSHLELRIPEKPGDLLPEEPPVASRTLAAVVWDAGHWPGFRHVPQAECEEEAPAPDSPWLFLCCPGSP